MVINLFIYSISSGFSLDDCTFLGICPFLLGFLFYWHILGCIDLIILCISVEVISNFSIFILIFLIWALVFLVESDWSLSTCWIFSENELLVSLIFPCCFLSLYFIYFPRFGLLWFLPFYQLWVLLVLFPVPLRVIVRLFILYIYIVSRVCLCYYKFPS